LKNQIWAKNIVFLVNFLAPVAVFHIFVEFTISYSFIMPIAIGGMSAPSHASLQLAHCHWWYVSSITCIITTCPMPVKCQCTVIMAGNGLYGHLVLTMATVPYCAMTANVAVPVRPFLARN
jgi:hypothetical protein